MLIDCKRISKEIKDKIRIDLENKSNKPTLTVIHVGNDKASTAYINGKRKDCEEVGIIFDHVHKSEDITEDELLEIIGKKVAENVDGILVQLPLPVHIDKNKIIAAIPKEKDVDGFRKDSEYVPCTPAGIMQVLKTFNLDGKDCLIINRSDIVGRPLVKLLLDKNATVTVAHSHTKNLDEKIANADIVITGVGIPNFIELKHLSRDKIFIDVSINHDKNGKVCGDLNPQLYHYHYDNSYMTPVPNGIGLMTRAMLVQNVYDAHLKNGGE